MPKITVFVQKILLLVQAPLPRNKIPVALLLTFTAADRFSSEYIWAGYETSLKNAVGLILLFLEA